MALSGLLHRHSRHRARQLRWVVPLVSLMLVAVLTTLVVQYRVSDQAVGTEFFRAHKTISHTGELLRRGLVIGGVVLTVLMVVIAAWVLHVTHRIVRPVHTMHRALDALAGGDLGVRVELHRSDEFGEVAEALNRLVDEFAGTLSTVHALVDRIAALSAARGAQPQSADAQIHALIVELDQTVEFFRLGPRRIIREDGD
jgi:methyl-accepting chemotaxis protein